MSRATRRSRAATPPRGTVKRGHLLEVDATGHRQGGSGAIRQQLVKAAALPFRRRGQQLPRPQDLAVFRVLTKTRMSGANRCPAKWCIAPPWKHFCG